MRGLEDVEREANGEAGVVAVPGGRFVAEVLGGGGGDCDRAGVGSVVAKCFISQLLSCQ